MRDANFGDDLTLLANTPTQTISYSTAERGIFFYVNADPVG